MPNLLCPAGHVIDLSVTPTPGERVYLPAAEWDDLVRDLARAALKTGQDEQLIAEAISDALAGRTRSFYECPVCGRLVFPDETPPLGCEPVPYPEADR